MFFNRKLKEENVKLKYRVAELEERLCPCEQHELIEIGKQFVMLSPSPAEGEYLRTYKCKRCGKVIRKYNWE